jgi:hypothetical protein
MSHLRFAIVGLLYQDIRIVSIKIKTRFFRCGKTGKPHCFKQPLPYSWQLYLQLFIYDTCYPCRVSPSSILCASRNHFGPVRVVRKDLCFSPDHLLPGFVRIYFGCEVRSRFLSNTVLRRYESSQHCVSLPRR